MTRVRFPSSIAQVPTNTAVASFPQPTAAGGGGDISIHRDAEGFNEEVYDVSLRADKATLMDGALALYGEDDNGEAGFIGLLNNGDPIRIQSAAVGFNEPIAGAGGFKRLLVGGYSGTVTPSGGALVTAKVRPMWTKRG